MTAASSLSLAEWGESQLRLSAERMAENVSATSLVMERPCFSQIVRPAKGAVLAAAATNITATNPDYFFHWLRDSATVMDAGLVLIREGIDAERWRANFADFVRFSLYLKRISGRRFLRETDIRGVTEHKFRQFLRPEEELMTVEGEKVLDEVRYNADGTIDFLRWSRPQYDGPAARALTVLRFYDAGAILPDAERPASELLRMDLGHTRKVAGRNCVDIWEEEDADHYYTHLLQFAALAKGAEWAAATGDKQFAADLDVAARGLGDSLDRFWCHDRKFLRSRIPPPGRIPEKELDFAVILGLLHSGMSGEAHTVRDERALATMQSLEDMFGAEYALNREAGQAFAFGRYKGDSYFSGGAWFLCSFGAAEFYYRLAAAKGDIALLHRGDIVLDMARKYIPKDGDISEQFDQTTGEQTSAKNLTWSHAAFITMWAARKAALAASEQLAGAAA
jgi:glucoamylase